MFAPRLFTASSLRTVLSVNRCVRNFSLPAHLVVNMPSLSPTMQTGTIGKWNCKVGDKIAPGDSMADVETDKASMTFEAQDDFYIAKLLVESGAEVKVGDPILVTVEDPSFVSAFANFTAPNAPAAPVPAPAPVVEAPKPAAPTPSAPKAAPAPSPVAQPTHAPAPAAPKAAAPAPVAAPSANNFLWGQGAKKSALAKKLSADQAAYIKKYGKSSQKPL